MISIYENYKDYRAPTYAHATIEELVSSLPKHCVSGLEAVVLTNAAAIGKGKTGRIKGKKHLRQECLGYYHPKTRDGQPWIEIVVDNVIAAYFSSGAPRVLWRVPLVRNMQFADTLFHEVGHHLDHTVGAPAPSGEAAAEAWKTRLLRSYARKRYWYLVPFIRFILSPSVNFIRRIARGVIRRRNARRVSM